MKSTNKPAAQFKDVAFVLYPVKDVAKAREFYEGVLGLTVGAQWESDWVEYDIGNGTLAIAVEAEVLRAGNTGARVAIEVSDMDATLEALKENNVKTVREPWESPSCRGCFINDPDGNEIMLHLRKPDGSS